MSVVFNAKLRRVICFAETEALVQALSRGVVTLVTCGRSRLCEHGSQASNPGYSKGVEMTLPKPSMLVLAWVSSRHSSLNCENGRSRALGSSQQPGRSTTMNGLASAAAGTPRSRTRFIEETLRELAHMPVTEACVSGLCDICLACQTCFCESVGRPWKESDSSRRSGEK